MAVTRYYPNCGLERREGERFCRNCGHELGAGGIVLHETPVATTAPLERSPAPENRVSQGVLPPPPSAAPPVASGPNAALRLPPFKPLALAGGLAMVVAVFLPWISGGPSVSAFDIPLEAVWDMRAGDGPVELGFVVLALILGFTLQLYRSIDQAGGTVGDVIDAIGIGIYVAVAGAVCLEIST